jgi:hypothetical protein
MQEMFLHQIKTPARPLEQPPGEIIHFTLQNLLPAGHTLALNLALGTLSLLIYNNEGPQLVAQQQFTDSEICVLKPLLESYPHFCPYEVLLASFNSTNVTDQEIERSRKKLQTAQEERVWDQQMRPVRNVLSRTRLKLHAFRVDIFSILETGYVLMPRNRYRQRGA